jgi:XXXCH domain-containing protein
MSDKKVKIEKTLASDQIAAFLRLMADEIEGKGGESLREIGLDLHSFNKIKLGLIKSEGGQLTLTLKVKSDGRQSVDVSEKLKEFEDLAEMKYRPLKKIFNDTFRAMARAVTSQSLPAQSLVTDFLAQARAMVAYPGFGDDYYDQFSRTCEQLSTAFLAKDVTGFAEIFSRIAAQKKECHGRYK